MTLDRNTLLEAAKVAENAGTLGNAQTIAAELRALAAAQPEEVVVPPLDPTKEMIEAGAQRLVRWETGKEKWPDAWSALDVRASRNDAERVWRSMWLAAQEGYAPAAPDAAQPAAAVPVDRPTPRTAIPSTMDTAFDAVNARRLGDLCRQLERELTGAKATIERQGTTIEGWRQELAKARAKIERMRPSEEALEIAKTCSKYWDADDAYLMAREILRIDK